MLSELTPCAQWYKRRNTDSDEEHVEVSRSSVVCGCHNVVDKASSRGANLKLVIASLMAFVFMIGELLGGFSVR